MIKAMLKKVFLGLLLAAFVRPPVAEAAYLGTINRQGGYTFEMTTGASVTWSATFLSVVRGRLEVTNMISGNGNLPPITVPISRSAERGIVLVDTLGGSALVRINDGGSLSEFSANPDIRIVFDLTG
jgi:hypothetical protein